MLQSIANWTPLDVNKECSAVIELEKMLMAKQPIVLNEIKAQIAQCRDSSEFTKETINDFKEKLLEAITAANTGLYDESIADEYLFDKLYLDIWSISDDEVMQDKQFRDKMLIFQCYLKPENLGIGRARSNFAVYQLAIKGILRRAIQGQ